MPTSRRHIKRRNKKAFPKSQGGSKSNERPRVYNNTPLAEVNRHSEKGMDIRFHEKVRRRDKKPYVGVLGYIADKTKRAFEKARLAAYLKGQSHFTFGFEADSAGNKHPKVYDVFVP